MMGQRPILGTKTELGRATRIEPKIVALGACTPLGLNALQMTTAIRAQKREVRGSVLRDRREAVVGLVHARFLPESLFGIDRQVRLALPALLEATSSLKEPVPLFLGLAGSERPDLPGGAEKALVERILRESNAPIDPEKVEVFRAGNASLAFALEAALRAFALGLPAAIVGSVDSYIEPRAIDFLDDALRLHAHGIEDGIIPSEGAAFALLVAGHSQQSRELFGPVVPRPMAVIRDVTTGRDELALDPEGPILGAVSTELVQGALAIAGGPPGLVITDIDEMHRITEWSRVELRCHPTFENMEHIRLPDRHGDTGAATGAIGLVYACHSFSLGTVPRGDVLVLLASDGSERGVILLSEAS